jgi:hypothetical protein
MRINGGRKVKMERERGAVKAGAGVKHEKRKENCPLVLQLFPG